MARSSYLFTSESVSEGHPDKVCDRISDEVVDLFFAEGEKSKLDPYQVRVACETLATTNRVVLEQIRVKNLELACAPVTVTQRALDHFRIPSGVAWPIREQVQDPAVLTS